MARLPSIHCFQVLNCLAKINSQSDFQNKKNTSSGHLSWSRGKKQHPFPKDPGMVYLPTFTIKNQPNVGKYTIHGAYGFCVWLNIAFVYPGNIPSQVL